MNESNGAIDSPLWQRIDELLALADQPPPELQGIAGWRAEVRGDLETAARFHDYRRSIAFGSVSAVPLLTRIRAAVQQPILLLKGPEVAARYPVSAVRPYDDLDLLIPDVVAAETALLATGFTFAGSMLSEPVPWHHHRLPMRLPGTALNLELHRDPGWLTWMTPPSNRELFARAIPSATGVDGIWTLPPREHTLFLAMHSWRHGPYHSLLHMIDIELMRQGVAADDLQTIARSWGIERVWRHTTRMLDWCFHDPSTQLDPLERIWSAHIREMRARSNRHSRLMVRTACFGAPTSVSLLDTMRIRSVRDLSPRAGQSFWERAIELRAKSQLGEPQSY